jgi:peptidoglycan biosynthesis protein MviN/MurJ (putative lipid II flippase)
LCFFEVIETTIVIAALKRFFTDEEAESDELLNQLQSMAPYVLILSLCSIISILVNVTNFFH